jgi:sialidase-1
VLCTHAARGPRGGIYVTVSEDQGRTWRTDRTRVVTNDLRNYDSTYPTSAQTADGTVVTVWYANMFGKFFIAGLRYRPEAL